MRVVSWNMGLADRSRRFAKTHEEAWRYLLGLKPDLAFLQESFPPDWIAGEGQVARDPYEKWGSLIFGPGLTLDPLPLPEESPLSALSKYLAFASVSLDSGEPMVIASVHAPPRRAEGAILGGRDPESLLRSVEGPKHNDAIFAGLVPLVDGRRFLLAGDWNTARTQRTERESRAGALFFERVDEQGWHDCTWAKLQAEIQTWFGPGSIKQDDYVFCDPALGRSVSDVSVAADGVTEFHLSDHAPLIVDFDET